MKIVIAPTNSSSSNTMIFGWPINTTPQIFDEIVWFLEKNAHRPEKTYGRFVVGNLEVACTNTAIVIGYPVSDGIDVGTELVEQLLGDVLLFLESIFGEKYSLDNLYQTPEWKFGISLEHDGWGVSAPGLIFFSAGSSGQGMKACLTNIISIRWGTPPMPNVNKIRRQLRRDRHHLLSR